MLQFHSSFVWDMICLWKHFLQYTIFRRYRRCVIEYARLHVELTIPTNAKFEGETRRGVLFGSQESKIMVSRRINLCMAR